MPIERLCKDCMRAYPQYNTLQTRCHRCTKAKAKPINKQGKEWRKWQAFRKQWLKDNPPNHNGLYTCGVCFKPIPKSQLVLDHIKPQGVGHRGKYDPNNIQPAHWVCNSLKGSTR